MVHELAHQWFGDSVSPWEWSDLWLNEGHATWYELLYRRGEGPARGRTPGPPTLETPHAAVLRARRTTFRVPLGASRADRSGRRRTSCSARRSTSAARSSSTPSARRSAGGPSLTWSAAGRSASGAARCRPLDYIALASEVAGRDLTGFLRAWLYGTKTPPMPGHPDWTVTPAAWCCSRAPS